MVLTPDFSIFVTSFQNLWMFGRGWIIPLGLSILIMAVITKDIEKWKIMLFPMLVIQTIIGMPVNALLMAIIGIQFALEALSTQIVGNIIGTIKRRTLGGQIGKLERKVKKRSKITKLFETANLQERKAFGQTKGTQAMNPDLLEEMRKRMGLQK